MNEQYLFYKGEWIVYQIEPNVFLCEKHNVRITVENKDSYTIFPKCPECFKTKEAEHLNKIRNAKGKAKE